MGSALLYFAIVVMWLSVLLPMWLRRDRQIDEDLFNDHPADVADEPDVDTVVDTPSPGDRSGQEDALDELAEDASPAEAARSDGSGEATGRGEAADSSGSGGSSTMADPSAGTGAPAAAGAVRSRAGRQRARIMARRRRRLLWSILLVLASVVTAAVRVMPWWGVAPSGALLVGYLAVLRVAVRTDREQRERAARLRAEHLRRQREQRRAMAREAEIIEFEARKRVKVFDQYAEGRRAVGG